MSVSRRIAFAIAVSWISRATNVIANFFLMPILFRYMGKEELGVWFLLWNSRGFLGLLGMGIVPTLTRHIALAKGRSGADPNVALTEETQKHIADLLATGSVVLKYLALATFVIAWIIGYLSILELELDELPVQTVVIAWTLMCVGYSLEVWISYFDCWLVGVGYVGWNNVIVAVISLTTILVDIGVVVAGGGLLALSIVSIIFTLAQRLAMLTFIKRIMPKNTIQGQWNTQYAKAMMKPSIYAWLTGIGSFLILKTDDYFIAFLKNVSDIPNYRAGYQLVSNLLMLVAPISGASSVFISHMWQAGNLSQIHTIVIRNARLSLCIMAIGVAFVMTTGKEFINLWLGEGNFIGYPIIFVFSVMLTLEAHHNILASSARATEDEKYVVSAIGSGVLNVIFTWILIKPLGLLGVAIGTMMAQLLTNNWYAVYRPFVRLKLRVKNYLQEVIFFYLIVITSTILINKIMMYLLKLANINSNMETVFTLIFSDLLIFIFVSWFFLLSEIEKEKLLKRMLIWNK